MKLGSNLQKLKADGVTFHCTPYENQKERKERDKKEQQENDRFYKENPQFRV